MIAHSFRDLSAKGYTCALSSLLSPLSLFLSPSRNNETNETSLMPLILQQFLGHKDERQRTDRKDIERHPKARSRPKTVETGTRPRPCKSGLETKTGLETSNKSHSSVLNLENVVGLQRLSGQVTVVFVFLVFDVIQFNRKLLIDRYRHCGVPIRPRQWRRRIYLQSLSGWCWKHWTSHKVFLIFQKFLTLKHFFVYCIVI